MIFRGDNIVTYSGNFGNVQEELPKETAKKIGKALGVSTIDATRFEHLGNGRIMVYYANGSQRSMSIDGALNAGKHARRHIKPEYFGYA